MQIFLVCNRNFERHLAIFCCLFIERREESMFHIAICDDDEWICTQLEQFIAAYAEERKAEISRESYLKGGALENALAKGRYYDLIFLDIMLGTADGVDIGKALREDYHNQTTQLVYISGAESRAMELFNSRPLNFLIKPLKAPRVFGIIDQAMELKKEYGDFFIYRLGEERKQLPLCDIRYFKSDDRKVTVYHKYGTDTFNDKLDHVEEQLADAPFVRIHKSYLVYYRCIRQIFQNCAVLADGTELPISRRYHKKALERINDINKNRRLQWM